MRRHNDDRQLRMLAAQLLQRPQARRTGHVEVQQEQVGVGAGIDQVVKHADLVGLVDDRTGKDPADHTTQGFAKQRVVIGDKQDRHRPIMPHAVRGPAPAPPTDRPVW